MKQLFWATDIHLNFLDESFNKIFLGIILAKVKTGNAIVVTGDIAEAPSIAPYMEWWKQAIEAQGSEFFFVCGNHDFYRGSIAKTREKLCAGPLGTNYLNNTGVVKLADNTALVGHDGWYDGEYDNWFTSKLDMMDYHIITELGSVFAATRHEKFIKIQKLAQEGADHVYAQGTLALKTYDNLFIATHVPPFREAAVHNGKESDPTWMPHFSSKKMGDAIRKLAKENPTKQITVLCGHTHGEGICYPEPNVVCYTGKAEYRYPQVDKNSWIVK